MPCGAWREDLSISAKEKVRKSFLQGIFGLFYFIQSKQKQQKTVNKYT